MVGVKGERLRSLAKAARPLQPPAGPFAIKSPIICKSRSNSRNNHKGIKLQWQAFQEHKGDLRTALKGCHRHTRSIVVRLAVLGVAVCIITEVRAITAATTAKGI